MITGSLKNKIDSIWQDFYNENVAQNTDIINYLTSLMFIKMLDDKQVVKEKMALLVSAKLNTDELTFKSGNFIDEENGIDVPYENLRWKSFKHLNSSDLSKLLKNYVFPFMKQQKEFKLFQDSFTYGFEGKERLLQSVVDKLSDEELDFGKSDILGNVYQYLISRGVTGQFRTPEHIINMMVELMKPKIGEKIIDPAMGTAGFLVSSSEYIKQNQTEDLLELSNKKQFNEEMFYGCDTDKTMTKIASMNLTLHGIDKPNLSIDSLLEKENAADFIEKFDLLLANPPFAGSIVETATNGSILAISKTKKTELLFTALFTRLLKVGGRCASIVPDGVLFGSSNAHKTLRQELVDHQQLVGIISMPSGIFQPYSGVKTSILIFNKTNNGGTDKVWFYDMTADGYSLNANRTPIEANDIPDIIERFNNIDKEVSRTPLEKSFMVDVEKIREEGYDLSLNKYKEIEREVKVFRPTNEILNDLKELNKKQLQGLEKLEVLLNE